jgi:hypothetical protein
LGVSVIGSFYSAPPPAPNCLLPSPTLPLPTLHPLCGLCICSFVHVSFRSRNERLCVCACVRAWLLSPHKLRPCFQIQVNLALRNGLAGCSEPGETAHGDLCVLRVALIPSQYPPHLSSVIGQRAVCAGEIDTEASDGNYASVIRLVSPSENSHDMAACSGQCNFVARDFLTAA